MNPNKFILFFEGDWIKIDLVNFSFLLFHF